MRKAIFLVSMAGLFLTGLGIAINPQPLTYKIFGYLKDHLPGSNQQPVDKVVDKPEKRKLETFIGLGFDIYKIEDNYKEAIKSVVQQAEVKNKFEVVLYDSNNKWKKVCRIKSFSKN